MPLQSHARRLAHQRRAATAVEFAMVMGVFIPLCMGIIEGGLLLWTRGALQSTAGLTARCVAIGSSNCTDGPQFAVTTANNWMITGALAKANVTITTVTSCNGAAGNFIQVNILSPFWADHSLVAPFVGYTVASSACYPK